jgi:hypothetical protein
VFLRFAYVLADLEGRMRNRRLPASGSHFDVPTVVVFARNPGGAVDPFCSEDAFVFHFGTILGEIDGVGDFSRVSRRKNRSMLIVGSLIQPSNIEGWNFTYVRKFDHVAFYSVVSVDDRLIEEFELRAGRRVGPHGINTSYDGREGSDHGSKGCNGSGILTIVQPMPGVEYLVKVRVQVPVHEAISLSFAVQQLRGVVLDVVYVLADLEGLHLVGGERTQQVKGGRDRSPKSNQRLKSPGVQDDWLTIVNGSMNRD